MPSIAYLSKKYYPSDMNQVVLKKKIMHLQAELNLLKMTVCKDPDPKIDEINWKKIEPDVKKIRKQLYKKTYG